MGYTKLERLRKLYQHGDDLELVHMEDAYGVPSGTRGVVDFVDDSGNVHMKWENGSTLSFIPEIDQCKKITQ